MSIDLSHPASEFLEAIPIAFARQHQLLAVRDSSTNRLTLAMTDVNDATSIDIVRRLLARPLRPVAVEADTLASAINDAYQQRTGQTSHLIASIESLDARSAHRLEAGGDVTDLLGQIEKSRADGQGHGGGGGDDLLDAAARAPVIRMVNLLLFEAARAGASDLHVQPYEDRLTVRLRIDGVLYDSFTLPRSIQDQVVSRLKVMGRMNIAEKRLPQDGRASVQLGDRLIDLRLASLPTHFGERVVDRLLEKSTRLFGLAEIGMDADMLERFRRLIAAEHGIILVTGPTGSGKTTTLYAALQEINGVARNILTLEDPIEYRLDGISQTQVSEKKGMTFASGLRSVLRQDPDVIMVGEIRDRETATMAIQSALTGHLVFSTLHTNDAASAVTRLLDLGIEPFLLASSVIGVLAQRLVRRVCGNCRGVGCEACRMSGYRGRFGLFELLTIDDRVRRTVQDRADASTIRAASGMRTLRDDGMSKASDGDTTVDEVLRVTSADEETPEHRAANHGTQTGAVQSPTTPFPMTAEA